MLHLTTQLHIALFLFSTTSLPLTTAQNTVSGSGRAERYWDCCKPDCSWVEHSPSNQPSAICDAGNNHLTDFTERSSCGGGGAYACANQSPWALNDTFSYGYAGVFLIGHAQPAWCCACYELTFDSGKLEGKRMIVQAHNSGFDLLTVNRFALAIPGGNTSYNGACAKQYGVPNSVFGVDGKGVQSLDDCENLPEVLQPGCRWRFGWFEDESYPTLNYTRVRCPSALTERTGCIRDDEDQVGNVTGVPGAATTGPSRTGLMVLEAAGFAVVAAAFLGRII